MKVLHIKDPKENCYRVIYSEDTDWVNFYLNGELVLSTCDSGTVTKTIIGIITGE